MIVASFLARPQAGFLALLAAFAFAPIADDALRKVHALYSLFELRYATQRGQHTGRTLITC